MLERYVIYTSSGEQESKIIDTQDDGRPYNYEDVKVIVTLLNKQQATIADLQGQVDAANTDFESFARNCAGDIERLKEERDNERTNGLVLQQRVAQLESMLAEEHPGLDEVCDKLTTLQADHARVLGLVQALGVVGLPAEHTRPDDFILLKTGEGWMAHTYNYWAKFATEEEARAYIALLEYRASLPAQPAQGHEHVWGTDGAHSNEYCKVCFVNKPQPAQGGELCTYCKLPLTENHSFSYGFPGVPRVYKCDRPGCIKPDAEGGA